MNTTNACESNNDRALERVCKATSRNVLHVKHVPEVNTAQCNTREMIYSCHKRLKNCILFLRGLLRAV
jgi:hypothetical protein